MHIADRYSYRVFWSEVDREYVGTVVEFPGLSHLDRDPAKALNGIRELTKEVVDSNEFETPAPSDINSDADLDQPS